MDGESIFYIIVAIVYFAVSILNSRKKAREKKQGKVRPRPVPQEETSAPAEPTLEDIIGQLFGEEEAPEPVRPVADPISSQELQRQRELAEKARLAEQREQERRREMLVHRQKMEEVSKRMKKTVKKPSVKKGKIYADLSLKDAIIAQTILERPYK